jgi:hypothetical protein
VKMRASLAEAHSKLVEQSGTLRLIHSICKGLERDVTVIVPGGLGLSGTSISTDAPPNNPTDAGPADGGLADADKDDGAAAQTGLDPISTNIGSTGIINTGTLMAVEATDTPAQTEMETEMDQSGDRRSRRKRPGNPMGLVSKRTRRA